MSKLNSNIPSFKGLIRKSYLTKNIEDKEEFINKSKKMLEKKNDCISPNFNMSEKMIYSQFKSCW